MPHNASLAAAFAAAPAVSTPAGLLFTVEQWVAAEGQSFLSTPEQRANVVKTLMEIYDALAATLGRTSVIAGGAFGIFRPTFESGVTALVNSFAPAPVPAPVVTPAVNPIGSAGP